MLLKKIRGDVMKISGMYGFVILFFLLFISGCGSSTPPVVETEGPEPKVYEVRATNALVKILPPDDFTQFAETFNVQGARGETEPFQVLPVLIEGTKNIKDVMLYASDLKLGSNVIGKENISIFKEYYLHVTEPSDAGGQVGYWPDPLAPLTTPFDVVDNFPSTLWVEIRIPEDAVPGIYDGVLTFQSSDAGEFIFEYTLEVWDIDMPKRLFLKANFGLDQEDIAWAHQLTEEGLRTPEGLELVRQYAHFLAKKYISVHGVPVFRPEFLLRPDGISFDISFKEVDKDIVTFIDGYDLPCYYFPLSRFDLYPDGFIGRGEQFFTPGFNARFLDYVNQVSAHLELRGVLDRAFVLFVDEPYDLAHYELLIDSSNLLRQADIYPRLMVTEQPAPQGFSFPELYDYVDIFTTNIRVFKVATEEDLRAGAENNEEWIYSNTSVYPFPSYSIDKQGMETRLFVWFAYQHKYKGIFYSSANDWSKTNPYEDPLTFGPGMGNGCNNMMYPGFLCNKYTGQDNVDGPLTSIRLELTRDGLEDAQLLYMLGEGEPVEEAMVLIPDWEEYSRDTEQFYFIRNLVANLIMEKS